MEHNLAVGWPICVVFSYAGDNSGEEVCLFIFKPSGEF